MSCAVKFDNLKKKLKGTDVVIYCASKILRSSVLYHIKYGFIEKALMNNILKHDFPLLFKLKSLFCKINSSNNSTESHRLNINLERPRNFWNNSNCVFYSELDGRRPRLCRRRRTILVWRRWTRRSIWLAEEAASIIRPLTV